GRWGPNPIFWLAIGQTAISLRLISSPSVPGSAPVLPGTISAAESTRALGGAGHTTLAAHRRNPGVWRTASLWGWQTAGANSERSFAHVRTTVGNHHNGHQQRRFVLHTEGAGKRPHPEVERQDGRADYRLCSGDDGVHRRVGARLREPVHRPLD